MYKSTKSTKSVDNVRGKDDAVREMDRGSFLKRGVAGLGPATLGLAPAAAHAATTRSSGSSLGVVAYSTPKPVMAKIIQDFQATPAGQGVDVSQSYGASTSQAKAIAAGQPADIAFLS